MWTVIVALIAGIILGALARLIMPGKQKIGVLRHSFSARWALCSGLGSPISSSTREPRSFRPFRLSSA
jgi:hypothetical protein